MAKKKNTYSIKFSHLTNYDAFELCRHTPLVVVKKNGETIEHGTWDATTPFPNPGAHEMGILFERMKGFMGEKIATTIIEYLDKDNGKPVLTLFPTYGHVHDGYENDFMAHLNHASRKDLAYQLLLRHRACKAH